MLTQAVFAENYTGRLKCSFQVQNQDMHNISARLKISEPEKNVERDDFGPFVVVDLDDASDAQLTGLTKTITSDSFKGKIIFDINFIYRRKVEGGNLVAMHLGLNFMGNGLCSSETSYARADASFPMVLNDEAMNLQLFPMKGSLKLIDVRCSQDRLSRP